MIAPKIVIVITAAGLEAAQITANSDGQEQELNELLKRIQPCLDIVDAIIKKTPAGPTG